jgi:acetylornithine deacetylase/succinyl-diaminopimelate desuccinylase-like protein
MGVCYCIPVHPRKSLPRRAALVPATLRVYQGVDRRVERGIFKETLVMNVIEFIENRKQQNLEELKEFVRIPSISTTTQHKCDVERAAHWVADHLQAAGMERIEVVPTPLHPLVYAESPHQERKPSVLVYGHYDVQPAESLELWTSPAFEPTVRDGRPYGRGTADDKGQLHAHPVITASYEPARVEE